MLTPFNVSFLRGEGIQSFVLRVNPHEDSLSVWLFTDIPHPSHEDLQSSDPFILPYSGYHPLPGYNLTSINFFDFLPPPSFYVYGDSPTYFIFDLSSSLPRVIITDDLLRPVVSFPVAYSMYQD